MKITVNKNKLLLTDIQPEELEILIKNFTVVVEGSQYSTAYKQGHWDGKKKYFRKTIHGIVMNKGYINVLKQLIPSAQVELKEPEVKVQVKLGYSIGNKVLREYQVEAVNSIGNNHNIGILNIATNGGKTITALSYCLEMLKLGKKVLFLTHSQDIALQVYQIATDLLTGFSVGMIGLKRDDYTSKFTVGLVHTLARRLNLKEAAEFLKGRDIVVIDECHHAVATTFIKVVNACKNASSIIGLTGTAPTSKYNKLELYGVVGSPIVKISNDKLIENKVSAEPICVIKTVFCTELEELESQGSRVPYLKAYTLGICYNKARNREIAEITKSDRKIHNNQVLILVEHLSHGEEIYRILLEEDFKHKIGVIEFIHGSTDSKERTEALELFTKGIVNVLIATSILDEGIDVSNIHSIIYARGGKSPRKLLQSIGRGLRLQEGKKTVSLYDFIDSSNEYLLEHSRERIKTLKRENFRVIKGANLWKDVQ